MFSSDLSDDQLKMRLGHMSSTHCQVIIDKYFNYNLKFKVKIISFFSISFFLKIKTTDIFLFLSFSNSVWLSLWFFYSLEASLHIEDFYSVTHGSVLVLYVEFLLLAIYFSPLSNKNTTQKVVKQYPFLSIQHN